MRASRIQLLVWLASMAGAGSLAGQIPATSKDSAKTPAQVAAAETPTRPRLTTFINVRYPKTGVPAGLRGVVFLQFMVDSMGVVDSSTIKVKSATDPAFVPNAIRTALREKFEPGQLHGHPVAVSVDQHFDFVPPSK